ELPFSVTHKCQSVPPISVHQCPQCCLSVLPIRAIYECCLQCPSVMPVNAHQCHLPVPPHQCPSVPPISVHQCSLPVPITAASLAHFSEGENSLIFKTV
ncbi:unnamed protein product, partial [Staurois parvus]